MIAARVDRRQPILGAALADVLPGGELGDRLRARVRREIRVVGIAPVDLGVDAVGRRLNDRDGRRRPTRSGRSAARPASRLAAQHAQCPVACRSDQLVRVLRLRRRERRRDMEDEVTRRRRPPPIRRRQAEFGDGEVESIAGRRPGLPAHRARRVSAARIADGLRTECPRSSRSTMHQPPRYPDPPVTRTVAPAASIGGSLFPAFACRPENVAARLEGRARAPGCVS